MSIQDLGSIGELIAALATLGTLIYLALQIRQNTSALESGSESDAALEFAAWHGRIAADPGLNSVFERVTSGASDLSQEEISRFRWLIGELFFIYEAQYRRYLRGLLTEEIWQRQVDVVIGFIEVDVITDFWRIYPIAPDFLQYLESQLDTERSTKQTIPKGVGAAVQPEWGPRA
jgi:hypothetical protein